ncbi:MAG: class I SAM-dependent methyltransferase [Ignavibacteria bacterium]|nr:class I SAM-dependent methyltransferase [Ignavibacteria bacterium]
MNDQKLYKEKNVAYFSGTRPEIISLVPRGIKKLLDVGCGNGDLAYVAKTSLAIQEVVGVELYKPAAEVARTKLDRVIEGNIEELALHFPDGHFDCIVCADVLEHTKDPWLVLRKLRRCLNDEGVLIASIPNLRHIDPILMILFDRFEYEESGILDKTHLRFFSLRTMRKMFDETGYKILTEWTNRSRSWKFKLLNLFSLGLMRPFSVYQYIFVVNKK